MNFKTILSLDDFEKVMVQNTGVLLYFSNLSCSVGEALEPKVIDFLKDNFPKTPFYYLVIG